MRIIHGDCLEAMAEMEADSVDAIVTDPPYGLGFMGKAWDELPPGLDWAKQCLRVLKPGGHLLAFGGTRTWHRLAVAVEDAGFEIRDSIAWLYGSGFPKSLDVSKAIDKAAGATGTYGEPKSAAHAGWLDRGRMRGEEGNEGWQRPWMQDEQALSNAARKYAPATSEAEQWQGWGTALKPAFEPIVVARKPIVGTVAANVLQHGTGALNIDGCRIEGDKDRPMRQQVKNGESLSSFGQTVGKSEMAVKPNEPCPTHEIKRCTICLPGLSGRWPANVVLDADQAAALDEQSGTLTSGRLKPYTERHENASSLKMQREKTYTSEPDSGGASRFFYVAREDDSCPAGPGELDSRFRYCAKAPKKERPVVDGVSHATVKPLTLMRWLVRLVTPPGGTVLDPFAGSGTTVEAALLEGFDVIGIERDADYLPLIAARIDRVTLAATKPTPAQETLDFGVA